jgi:hypothetical protein
LFSKPKTPKIVAPVAVEPEEEVQAITEEAEQVRKRERKRLLTGGRRATILSGITAALKKRLGE